MRPVIGITSSFHYETGRYYLPQAYVQAVEQAGGLPLILPWLENQESIEKLLTKLDGVLLSGGVDVDPAHFGEDPLPGLGEIAPERDVFEIALVKVALAQDMPLMAICRGIQLLNIAAGGDIYQDLSSQVPNRIKHSQLAPRYHASHRVFVQPDTQLAAIWQVSNDGQNTAEVGVNSFHHQAVRTAAPDFRVNALAPDGVIEGLESKKHRFVLGVQWHPECMWVNDAYTQQLFQAFIQAAKEERGLD